MQNKPKLYLGGTVRALNPNDTLELIKPVISKVGITRVADVTYLDTIGIPTFICIRPNAKHLSVSQGKGVTNELAKVSAIMESIEVYHAENPAPPDLFGEYDILNEKHILIDPKLFAANYFKTDKISNLKIPWKKAQDFISKKEVYLPHSLISLDSSSIRSNHNYFTVGSNGLASGNTFDEALCHALCEVIERDALYHQNKKFINLSAINDPIIKDLISKFHRAEVDVKVFDITSETGVPVFYCVAKEKNVLRGLGGFIGSGAHPLKEIALSRALTEAAQARLTLITGSRDDVFPSEYLQEQYDYEDEELEDECYDFNDIKSLPDKEDFDGYNQIISKKLQQNGFDKIFVVTHTKPEFNIPVVHVFVPGLKI